MNRKGFTMIELLATLLILSVVIGITVYSLSSIFSKTKEKTEDVFLGTIKDSLDIYLTSSNAKSLNFNITCSNVLKKTYGDVSVYKAVTTFQAVIDSEYKPITQDELFNPAREDLTCNNAYNIPIEIYRDSNYVYYYSVSKDSLGCLTSSGVISNLPEGFVC